MRPSPTRTTRRGGYAALALQADLADLPFAVRMGLNSGEVVVGAIGEDLAMEYTAIGRTVGLAQRMEQLAAPDSVYLSEHTAALSRATSSSLTWGSSRSRA